jgi:hypothetical protein
MHVIKGCGAVTWAECLHSAFPVREANASFVITVVLNSYTYWRQFPTSLPKSPAKSELHLPLILVPGSIPAQPQDPTL